MNLTWNTDYIDLRSLVLMSRGNKAQILKYLTQFQELIPLRAENLKESLRAENRKATRQILHQMSPQLQFFGVPDVIAPIRRLEIEYETIPIEELKNIVGDILIRLDHAIGEVALALKTNF